MFGYIAPLKSELKIREFEVYNAYYCAICHAVKKRYGELPRLMLSYDAVFIAMLGEGILADKEHPGFSSFRCFNNPFKKRNEAASSDAIDYAADVMVLLGWLSLKDGADDKDAGNFVKKAGTVLGEYLLRRAGGKAAERLGGIGRMCEEYVEEQKSLENAGEDSLDRAADPTGKMMSGILVFPDETSAQTEEIKGSLRDIGYHLGRYIYIIDAIDDLEKDRKSGAYNPLLLRPQSHEALKTAVLLDLAKVCEIMDNLSLNNHKTIIDNIAYLGLRARLDEVLEIAWRDRRKSGRGR